MARILLALLLFFGMRLLAQSASTLEPTTMLASASQRQTTSLNGQWDYLVDPYRGGQWDNFITELSLPKPTGAIANTHPGPHGPVQEYNWPQEPILAVLGDWNSQRPELLYYEGLLWYEHDFTLPSQNRHAHLLHFGAAAYRANVTKKQVDEVVRSQYQELEAGQPGTKESSWLAQCVLYPEAITGTDAMPSDLDTYIRRLPKAELHLHLEGTVTPQTLVELSARRAGSAAQPVLSPAAAQALYAYNDFSGFLLAFKAITEQLQTADDYELVTLRMLERLHAQGVVHAEVYVSVGVVYYWRRTEFEPLFAGMERARIEAEARWGITCYWIFDAVRHFGPDEAARVFRKAAEMRNSHPSIIGIGIGGDERRTGSEPFRELYAEAATAGLRLTAHAGETVGPGGIWGAINIGAERIGHALSAVEDPELMAVLAERQIPLEICVTSNLRTASCPSIHEHPVRTYFDGGLMITLNSDDPTLFGSDLEGEYRIAVREFDFTREQLRELAANSIEASFLPPERKVSLLHQLEAGA